MVSCGTDKHACKSCRWNEDGFCTLTKKPIDKLYKQWFSNRRSKVRRSVKDNMERFDVELFYNMMDNVPVDVFTVDGCEFMNELLGVMQKWRLVDTDFVDDEWMILMKRKMRS